MDQYLIEEGEEGEDSEGTWAPWLQVLRRAEKLPASEKSESPKACWSVNWILESEEDSENLLRVVVVVVVAAAVLGCDGWESERPPSRPNSSSSRRSSSDWKAGEREKRHVSSTVAARTNRNTPMVSAEQPSLHSQLNNIYLFLLDSLWIGESTARIPSSWCWFLIFDYGIKVNMPYR